MSAWQPIDTAPKDGTRIMGWDSGGHFIVFTLHWSSKYDCWMTECEQWTGNVKHWQPLPEPPQ